jgi:hypothetical protein
MALSNIWGLLEACGPIGGLIARPGRLVSKLVQVTNKYLRPFPGNGKRKNHRRLLEWKSHGMKKSLLVSVNKNDGVDEKTNKIDEENMSSSSSSSSLRIASFLDVYDTIQESNNNKSFSVQQRTNKDDLKEIMNHLSIISKDQSAMNVDQFEEWINQRPAGKS